MRRASSWYSERIEQEIDLVRWGHWGQPVLVFPTAGGDAEEIERMQLVGALWPLIEAGRIKVYSCDNIAGRAFAARTGSVEYRCALLDRFEECVAREVVPAIRADCGGEVEVIAAGASLGAFMAVAVACRYPWLFRAAVGMSGSYDLERVFEFKGTGDYYFATPMSFVPNLRRAAARRAAPALRHPRLRRRAVGEPRGLVAAGGRARGQGHPEPGRSLGAGVRPRLADLARDAAALPGRADAEAMNVIFLEPGFPANQRQFVRALASVGAYVIGVGDRPYDWLDDELKGWLGAYQQIASVTDEGALEWAVRQFQGRMWIDRLEAVVEAHVLPAAHVRERCGIPGISARTAYLCRDKVAMKEVLREGRRADRGLGRDRERRRGARTSSRRSASR